MQLLTGTRYGLPADGVAACKLGKDEQARVRLRGFYKGHICVGKKKFSCIFLKPVDDASPWIYCSKGAFINIVQWMLSKNLSWDDEFVVIYEDALNPYTDTDLNRRGEIQRLAVIVEFGPSQGVV